LSFWWEIPLENAGNGICKTLDFKIFSGGRGCVCGGCLLFFYQPSTSKLTDNKYIKQLTNDQYCSFQEVRLVRIPLRKGNFWQCQNVKFSLLLGALPPGPPTGICPCTLLGALAAPKPPALGGGGGGGVSPAPKAVYFENISAYFKSY